MSRITGVYCIDTVPVISILLHELKAYTYCITQGYMYTCIIIGPKQCHILALKLINVTLEW